MGKPDQINEYVPMQSCDGVRYSICSKGVPFVPFGWTAG